MDNQLSLIFPVKPKPDWESCTKACPLLSGIKPGDEVMVLMHGEMVGAIATILEPQGYLVAVHGDEMTIINSRFCENLREWRSPD
ncbi:MAG: hypothetical protein AAGA75_14240 [Cyanobacteria bacterium P01_E01_bin.6]